jgi:hypothetical protein
MGWRTFRDRLALLMMIIIIPGLWVGHGLGWLKLPETIIGATIMAWTLCIQFYFRKSGPTEGGNNGGTGSPDSGAPK